LGQLKFPKKEGLERPWGNPFKEGQDFWPGRKFILVGQNWPGFPIGVKGGLSF